MKQLHSSDKFYRVSFKDATGNPRVWFLERQSKSWLSEPVIIYLLAISRKFAKGAKPRLIAGFGVLRSWYKTHKPRHLDIHIKITLTRVVIAGLLLINFWPHSHTTIAEGGIVENKPPKLVARLKQPVYELQGEVASVPVEPVTESPEAPQDCGSDPQMAYIYHVESGCRSWAYNPGGCRGLGQACPGSKLPCGDYDWACQDNFFKNYAVSAYGSIYNAYLFRQSHNYW